MLMRNTIVLWMAGTAVLAGCGPQGSADKGDGFRKVDGAFVIPIKGVMTKARCADTKAAVGRCLAQKAKRVVFEIDTFGGSVSVILDIVHLITTDLDGVHTVAYANALAVSGGAMIALACDEMVVHPDARLGDVGVVLPEPVSATTMEKIVSVLRSKMALLAARNGYNRAICRAMVDPDMELWRRRNRRTGRVEIVDADDWRGKLPGAPGTAAAPADGEWEYAGTFVRRDDRVLLSAKEAIACGLAKRTCESVESLAAFYRVASSSSAPAENP